MNSTLIYDKKLKLSNIITRLDNSKSKTLFVLSKNRTLIGAISDGDIRRCIVKNKGLDFIIDDVINYEPISVSKNTAYEKINFMFKNYSLKAIPVLGPNKKIQKIIHLSEFHKNTFPQSLKKSAKISAVVMAGGKGTRMRPFTEILPKPLIPLDGKPILSKILDNFISINASNILVSINSSSKILKAFYSDDKSNKIIFIEEKKPLGTIGSLNLMKKKLTKDFFITNCDTIVRCDYFDIIDFHKKNKSILTVVGCEINQTIPYGICQIDKRNNDLTQIIEKPKNKFITNTGFYVANKSVIDFIPKNQKFDMDQLIKTILENRQKVSVFKINQNQWMDLGNWKEYNQSREKIEFE